MEKPTIYRIKRIFDEAEGIKTLFFSGSMKLKPGQFVMVWIPGVDEKPFGISYIYESEFGITVASAGLFSEKICQLKQGDKVGIRGPYGKGYFLEGRRIAAVSGGCGAASVVLLVEEAVRKGIAVKFILGARSKEKLLFNERLKKLVGEGNLIVTTDDGSFGRKGFVTDALNELLKKEKIDKVFACGPEKMLKAVAEIGIQNRIKGEISMERYMKCGFGICGHCCVDPSGLRLCVEGPVVDFETALKIKEFGSYRRAKSSKKERV